MRIAFTLNDVRVEADTATDAMLVDVLRGLGRTGTKEACGVGVCGACTVLVDGLPVSSCLYVAACADATEVWTVEGLAARDGRLVEAFVEAEGMQCGICTPGQVVSAYALRNESPGADEQDVRCFMSGNLCRCTGYGSIVAAVTSYLAAP
jgi:carbon-monoxide dehydrogenase small subunit